MADFALLGEAAARARGKKPSSFFDRYTTMARRQVQSLSMRPRLAPPLSRS